MKRAHVIYSGNVQGVGFRYTAVNCARGFAVTGWVQNTADRKVELIAEGQEIELFFKKSFKKVKFMGKLTIC